MRKRRKRSEIQMDAPPKAEWAPAPVFDRIAPAKRVRYAQRCRAVEMWMAGSNAEEIFDKTQCTARMARDLYQRCIHVSPLSIKPTGLAACIPGIRIQKSTYERTKALPTKIVAKGAGMSGALSVLFLNYPEIEKQLRELVEHREVAPGATIASLDRAKLFDVFLSLCKEHVSDQKAEYPFCMKKKGYEAIWRWYQEQRYEHPILTANNEAGENAARDTKAAYFAAKQEIPLPTPLAYSRVELDGHKFDVLWAISVPDGNGGIKVIHTTRIWVLVLVEVRTGAILSAWVAIADQYSRVDVLRCVYEALVPPPRYPQYLDDPEFRYREGAAYPAELKGFEKNGWQTLAFDAAKSQIAPSTLKAIQDALGCGILNERVGDPGARRTVEGTFTYFATLAEWFASATGNRPDSPVRRNAAQAAEYRAVDILFARSIVDVAARNYNTKPNDRSGGKPPLQKLYELAATGECYHNPLEDELWRLLPCHPARINRITSNGCLKPPYIELYGARYTSPQLANNVELKGLDKPDVLLYVEEDARYAMAARADTGEVIGRVAVVGKHSQTPHSLEVRRVEQAFMSKQRMDDKAVSPCLGVGVARGLAKVADSDDKAAIIYARVNDFQQRYMEGMVQPVSGTAEELEQLQSAISGLVLDDDPDAPGFEDGSAAVPAAGTAEPAQPRTTTDQRSPAPEKKPVEEGADMIF